MGVTTEAPSRVPAVDGAATPRPVLTVTAIGIGLVLLAGIVLRFVTTSDLWLDEALSVNVARLPLSDISEWLRHDGAPPLYYWLLHGWTNVFGTSALAVRSLSAIFSLATLPAMFFAGRRIGGRTGAWASLLITASSTFAIRFATEARMYSLIALLVAVGYLAFLRALERPSLARLAIVAVIVAALLYTQYWAMYLLAVIGALLVLRAWRAPQLDQRRAARSLIVAFVAGGIAFLPWVPNMLYQSEHTGTPWGERLLPNSVFTTMLEDFSGGSHVEDYAVYWVFNLLFLIAVFGAWAAKWRYELDLRTRVGARIEALVVVATVLVGAMASYVAGTTFQARYASVVFPVFVLVLAYGVSRLRERPLRALALVVVVALGLVGGVRNVVENRTQGGDVGRTISAESKRGDIVVYCPDQLGPGASRELDDAPGLVQMVFPTGDRPKLVDWVDYTERNSNADASAFAEKVLDRAGAGGTIWYVSSFLYAGGNEGKCEQIRDVLSAQRPGSTVSVLQDETIYESMGLTRYPPA